jgi:hypothetical protein
MHKSATRLHTSTHCRLDIGCAEPDEMLKGRERRTQCMITNSVDSDIALIFRQIGLRFERPFFLDCGLRCRCALVGERPLPSSASRRSFARRVTRQRDAPDDKILSAAPPDSPSATSPSRSAADTAKLHPSCRRRIELSAVAPSSMRGGVSEAPRAEPTRADSFPLLFSSL